MTGRSWGGTRWSGPRLLPAFLARGQSRAEKWWTRLSVLPMAVATALAMVALIRGHSPWPYLLVYCAGFLLFALGQALIVYRRRVRTQRSL